MPTTLDDRHTRHRATPPPHVRTSASERRRGIRLLVISVVVCAAMFGMWWLVASTNREGHHDAQLLPIFTLIPLLMSAYHLALARYLRSKGR